MRFHPIRPAGPRIDHAQQMSGDLQEQEAACPRVRIGHKRCDPGLLCRRRQLRLIDDVPIPKTAVVRTDIAQVVQASQPCREHPAVAHAVLAGNRVLLGLAKAVEQRRKRAELPNLAGHPDRQW